MSYAKSPTWLAFADFVGKPLLESMYNSDCQSNAFQNRLVRWASLQTNSKVQKERLKKVRNMSKAKLNITDIRVRRFKEQDNKSKIVGTAAITIDDAFVVHDIKIIDGDKGLFISMPSRKIKDKDGNEKYVDVAHPLNADVREQLTKSILDTYVNIHN